MKFRELSNTIKYRNTRVNVMSKGGRSIVEPKRLIDMVSEEYDKINDYEVVDIYSRLEDDENGQRCAVLGVKLDIQDTVSVLFQTEFDGCVFNKDETYDRFDFDDDEEMRDQIREDLNDWIEEVKQEIEYSATWDFND